VSKGEYIFSGHQLPNLYNIQTTTALRGNEKLIHDVFNHTYQHREHRFFDIPLNQERYIFMNVWCGGISSTDVVFHELKAGYTLSLENINAHYRETFVNNEIPNHKIMPVVEIPGSIYIENGFNAWIRKWHIDNPRGGGCKLVFIFNFTPLSAVGERYIMNNYIAELARRFPNTHTFMVPNHSSCFDIWTNIICCDRLFGYSETDRSFQNLFILETVVRECDIIVSQYCGASWIWFNENLTRYYDTHKKPIYITHPVRDNDYAVKMNTWIRAAGGGGGGGGGDRDVVEFVTLANLPFVLI